ncbi:argonaute-like protein [Mycena pura]|uniref:Argonaute-like protein n=1 Tax=Mycena pura TaxID=153505 RepID=A0AAD6UXZ4_9AGAR|nr:argonaute-like protein [Mycena pura]
MASIDVSVITNSFRITRQAPSFTPFISRLSRLGNLDSQRKNTINTMFVTFNPDLPIAAKRERVIHRLQTSIAPHVFHPRGVYDSRRLLYLSHQLNLPGGGSGRFTVSLGDNPNAQLGARGVFEVLIARTAGGTIRPSDLNRLIVAGQTVDRDTAATATNLLQLLIRQSSNEVNPTNNGRAFFSPEGKKIIENSGIELWRGFFHSVRPTIGQMIVTIDTSMAAIYESGQVLSVAMKILGGNVARDLSLSDDRQLHKVQTHLKGRLVKFRTPGERKNSTKERTKTIYEIVKGPIGRYPFNTRDKATTIQASSLIFFLSIGITLRYPNSFGVRLSGSNAPFAVIVPAELCDVIPGQLYKKRLPSAATSDAVTFATLRPRDRLRTITGGAHNIPSPITTYCTSEYIRDAGMDIETKPLILDAKLLEPPRIRFQDQEVVPRDGSWNVVNQKFRSAKALRSWAVVNLSASIGDELQNRTIAGETLKTYLLGMFVADPMIWRGEGHAVEKTLDAALRNLPNAADMIMVLLPSSAEEIKIRVKYWGDIKRGICTSCLRESKVQRANDQYYNNVAIKLNARLGGQYALPRTIVLDGLQKQGITMIIGADVAHPGPGLSRPSIASVVFSWDRDASQYIALSAVQAPRTEIIPQLDKPVALAIHTFKLQAGLPQRIVFYRDGVSEGEMKKVQEEEIKAVKDACKTVWADLRETRPLPKLTFIVVVKRHHTVFFPNDSRVGDSKGNCLPGLVVDQLKSPLGSDFYLQSHAAIQGSKNICQSLTLLSINPPAARSGHYTVLHDENFNMDLPSIQRLSFELCHVYAKATRSVSIPAPVYYADLVCGRGKYHIDPSLDMDIDGSTTSGGSGTFDLGPWERAYRPVNKNAHFDKTMYFL